MRINYSRIHKRKGTSQKVIKVDNGSKKTSSAKDIRNISIVDHLIRIQTLLGKYSTSSSPVVIKLAEKIDREIKQITVSVDAGKNDKKRQTTESDSQINSNKSKKRKK